MLMESCEILENAAVNAMTLLHKTPLHQLCKNLRRLIEVPFNATVRDTLNVMQANDILAVVVAAPPEVSPGSEGTEIFQYDKFNPGVGGSKIFQFDKASGVVHKHYLGLVSVVDILVHIVSDDEKYGQLNAHIFDLLGRSTDSINLWTFGADTSVWDALEYMRKKFHRVLVPFELKRVEVSGLEKKYCSPGYHILTQTDLLRFIHSNCNLMRPILNLTIAEVGAVKRSVFAVPHTMSVMTTLKCMATAQLLAVAIVEADPVKDEGSKLINGEGMKLIGTFSASDLRYITGDVLSTWSSISVLEWSQRVWVSRNFGTGAAVGPNSDELAAVRPQPPVTCHLNTALGDVIALALENHIHRVWVTDEDGCLMGLTALSEMLSVFHLLFAQGVKSYTS